MTIKETAKEIEVKYLAEKIDIGTKEKAKFNHWISKFLIATSIILPTYLFFGLATESDLKNPVEVTQQANQLRQEELSDFIFYLGMSGLLSVLGFLLYLIIFDYTNGVDYSTLESIQNEFNLYVKTLDWEKLTDEEKKFLTQINQTINPKSEIDDDGNLTLLMITTSAATTSIINSSIDC